MPEDADLTAPDPATAGPGPAADARGAATFAITLPVGAWTPLLPAALRSLTLQGAAIHAALCDASGDPRVAEAAEASGLAFAYRRHGPDAGQSAAIAEGWANADGDVLAWLNADDILMPGACKAAAAAFAADPSLDVWYGRSTYVDTDGRTTGAHTSVAPPSDLLLRSCTVSQPSCFVRRRAVEAVGGIDPTKHYVMDWDLWSRLYRAGARFEFSGSYYSAVLIDPDTKTATLPVRRMSEIFSVARAGAGGVAAAKSVVGATIHHWLNYSRLSRLLLRWRRTGAAPDFGSRSGGRSQSGRLYGTTTFPVINLSDREQSRLHVRLGGPGAARTRVEARGTHGSGADVALALDPPVAPGHTVDVTLRADSTAEAVWFERAGWDSW